MTDFRAPIDQSKQTPEQKVGSVVSPVAPTNSVVPNVSAINTEVVPNPEMKEGPLDRFIKKLVHFIAQMAGQPDPITGEKSVPTISGNIGQKVWDTANKTIEKVGDVAKKTVEITGSVVEKVGDVTQKAVETTTSVVNTVKEIKQDITGGNQPVTQPLESLEKSK